MTGITKIAWEFPPLKSLDKPDDLVKRDGNGSFLDNLKKAISRVDSLQKEADGALKGFAAGKIRDVHTVALTMKKAELSFRFMLAVRSKAIDAYRELTRLNV